MSSQAQKRSFMDTMNHIMKAMANTMLIVMMTLRSTTLTVMMMKNYILLKQLILEDTMLKIQDVGESKNTMMFAIDPSVLMIVFKKKSSK